MLRKEKKVSDLSEASDQPTLPALSDLLTVFRWRLAETITWCEAHGSLADPINSLRAPALQPACMVNEPDYSYDWGGTDAKQATIRILSETRADLLRAAGLYPAAPAMNVGHGRLLVSDPEDSDICGLSVVESLGFIDDRDVPPWDTWLWYGDEPGNHTLEFLQRMEAYERKYHNRAFIPPAAKRHWLCWIPTLFVPLVDGGIAVNPVECFWWAREYKERDHDTPFLRLLDDEGFLT